MATVSGKAAIAWMRSHSTNAPGMCLNTVWQSYGSHDSIGDHAGQYPDAMSGWNYAKRRHPGDANPPAGVPVYFGVSPTRTDANARAGDVMVSLGGGMLIGTDVGGAGRIGTISIADRARAISRPYLGWTEDFLGYDVVDTTAAAPAPAASAPAAPVSSAQYALGIADARGLQEMLKALYGYTGAIDNAFGSGSWAAFARFLRKNWGYVGNDVAGPAMWAAIARWLRARYGYVGNDVPGPVMRAALQRASTANGAAY